MPWLAHYNPEIDWKIGEVKITRLPEECRKYLRKKNQSDKSKKRRKQEKKRRKEKVRRKETEEEGNKQKERTIEVKKVTEE